MTEDRETPDVGLDEDLGATVGERWVRLLVAAQMHWHEHQKAPASERSFCRLCRVYEQDWWV
jgi:hypothetical protein